MSDEICVGVDLSKANVNQTTQLLTYENKDFTFRGEIKNYNYNKLLKDKQTHIYKFYELANYYVDADDIVSNIVKKILTPFSLSAGWRLTGSDEEIKNKYRDYYNSINFADVARSIFYELYLYANCYIYIMPDNSIMTLPPHRIRISDVMQDGEPVLEFNIPELKNANYWGDLTKKFIDTLVKKYEGYPPEVTEELRKGSQSAWVQLNPENTFVLQESKPMWQKYAIPFISTCLKPLAKKELISYYEDVMLNIAAKGFLHVKLGSDELLPKPTKPQLDATAQIFQHALNKFPLAVTSHLVDAKFIAIENKGLFDKLKYQEVNAQILASGGISPIVVTGESESGSSYAQATLSVETASQRIKQNQQNFSEMMKKLNKKLADIWGIPQNEVPKFNFNPLNLINDEKFKESAFKLWQQGCVSTRTLLNDYYDLDYQQELERKKNEKESGEMDIFMPPLNPHTMPKDALIDNKGGRPEKDMKDLKDDKNKSQTGKQPKPSNKK